MSECQSFSVFPSALVFLKRVVSSREEEINFIQSGSLNRSGSVASGGTEEFEFSEVPQTSSVRIF